MILLYDGSLEGYFSAVFVAYTLKEKHIEIEKKENRSPGLFDDTMMVENKPGEARRVLEGIAARMSRKGLNTIARAFLSEKTDCENVLLRFIQKGMKAGPVLLDKLTDPDALRAMEMSRKTLKEYHRFLGLLRFRKLDSGEYYAPFRPDTNLLPLLGRHFATRFPDQDWMIHDRNREYALVHIRGELEMMEMKMEQETAGNRQSLTTSLPQAIKKSESEDPYAELWRIYHKKIGIKGRANPKLQQQFMPKKHWEFLPEMEDNTGE